MLLYILFDKTWLTRLTKSGVDSHKDHIEIWYDLQMTDNDGLKGMSSKNLIIQCLQETVDLLRAKLTSEQELSTLLYMTLTTHSEALPTYESHSFFSDAITKYNNIHSDNI